MKLIDPGFEEFGLLAADCRYANCSHEHAPGCAVRAAIKKGELSRGRCSGCFKLKKESERHGMSYLEKRRKEKASGRYIKTVKKLIKD